MGQFSFWHWLIVLIFLLPLIPISRMLKRVGFSPWWALVFAAPGLGYVALWVFAYIRWPATDGEA